MDDHIEKLIMNERFYVIHRPYAKKVIDIVKRYNRVVIVAEDGIRRIEKIRDDFIKRWGR